MNAVTAINPEADRPAPGPNLARLRKTAGKVVGSVFYGTMLKMLRTSEMKGKYGHGGRAEEVFGAQLDAIRAESLGASQQLELTDVLYKRLASQQIRMDRATGAATSAANKR